mmetsp:Transcript_33014/g.65358  ORF Transcript_33014/g.65358 Transcript_33014/m.65358 type:complete len:327 (+) Transcript_33014:295-1275(+)
MGRTTAVYVIVVIICITCIATPVDTTAITIFVTVVFVATVPLLFPLLFAVPDRTAGRRPFSVLVLQKSVSLVHHEHPTSTPVYAVNDGEKCRRRRHQHVQSLLPPDRLAAAQRPRGRLGAGTQVRHAHPPRFSGGETPHLPRYLQHELPARREDDRARTARRLLPGRRVHHRRGRQTRQRERSRLPASRGGRADAVPSRQEGGQRLHLHGRGFGPGSLLDVVEEGRAERRRGRGEGRGEGRGGIRRGEGGGVRTDDLNIHAAEECGYFLPVVSEGSGTGSDGRGGGGRRKGLAGRGTVGAGLPAFVLVCPGGGRKDVEYIVHFDKV